MTNYVEEALPRQQGTMVGYDAFYLDQHNKWVHIPTTRLGHVGDVPFPYPAMHGGILSTVTLMGKAQAQALCAYWAMLEDAVYFDQRKGAFPTQTKIVEHKIKYSIECFKEVETEVNDS